MADKDIIEVTIGFNRADERVEYIKSDFMDEEAGFKDPIGYTARLIQMGLEEWIRQKVGISCPKCDIEFQEGWNFCANCGWNPDE